MLIIPLPQDLANKVRSGYVAASEIVQFLINQGFSKPSGKTIKTASLNMLKRGGRKITGAQFDIVAGCIHLTIG